MERGQSETASKWSVRGIGVDDEHGARRTVGDGVRHAAEDTPDPLHAFVAYHDQVCLFLFGDPYDRLGGATRGGVDLGLEPSLLDNPGQAFEQHVSRARQFRIPELLRELLNLD